MSKLKQVAQWIWKSWPLLCVLALACAHYFLIFKLGLNVEVVNGAIAFGSQIVGGLFVLYSVDSTIGILSGSSLKQDFISYLKEFPLIRRNIVVQVGGAAEINIAGKAAAISTGMPASIEEQILYLQNQIDVLRNESVKKFDELKVKIDSKSEQLNERIDSAEDTMREVEKKVADVSLGGVKIQLLGVMLLLYGTVTNYVA